MNFFMIRSLESGNWFVLYDNDVKPTKVEWSPNTGYVFNNVDEAFGIAALLNESVEVLMMESYWSN